ncbi:MAG TPA: vanadium-dependent haloperoxidase [Roseateles sp.]
MVRTLRVAGALLLSLLMAGAAPADVVSDWAEAAPKVLLKSPRAQWLHATLLTDLAMFNALNAITPLYEAYGPPPEPVPDASPDAAVAAAARTVLGSVPGADQALLDKTYEASLKAATDAGARAKGVALGRRVALALLALRADDTFARVEPPKVEPAPGIHVLTPEAKQESSIAITRLRPFAIRDVAAYDPGPPPAVGSAIAQRDLAEVKAVGGRVSSQRTAEQSVIALFWNSGEAEDGVQMLKTLAEGLKATPLEFARMLALTDMADFDSRLVYVGLKTRYRHWRPYNALRGTFADAKLRDAAWEPLIHTPPNSDYPSGGAVGGGYLQALLAAFRGSSGAPLVWVNTALSMTRSWATPEAMGRELADSRVWSGVHFRHSVEVGYRLGQKVAEEVLATQLRPLR